MTVLESLYDRMCKTPSDIVLHLPMLVELVDELKAETVVELGTRTGVSSIAWLYALEKTGGHLYSVDVDDRPDLPEFDHWTFIQGDDCSPRVYTQLPEADIVFIDTSHAYKHTLKELNLYRWLVKPGGRIVLHDTELPQPQDVGPQPPFPVKKAVTEFCRAEGLEWVNYDYCWGLAVISIPEEP